MNTPFRIKLPFGSFAFRASWPGTSLSEPGLGAVVGLLELNEHAHVVFGLKEHATGGLGARREATDTSFTKVPLRGTDIINSKRDMMNAAVRVGVQKLSNGAFISQWMQKLDGDIRQLDEHFGDHEIRMGHWIAHLRPECAPVMLGSCGKIWYRDGNVLQSFHCERDVLRWGSH